MAVVILESKTDPWSRQYARLDRIEHARVREDIGRMAQEQRIIVEKHASDVSRRTEAECDSPSPRRPSS